MTETALTTNGNADRTAMAGVVKRSVTLESVVDGSLCCGCGGCAAVAPDAVTMDMVEPGYLRPVQTGQISRDQERVIGAICPGKGLAQEPAGRTDDPLWGPIVEVRSGFAADPNLRWKASSGGALSAILIHLLECGDADAVLEIGADETVPFANRTVVCTSAEEVLRSSGSRYAPSAPLADLEEHLNDDRRFAFVGKPCDVAALRAIARIDPRVDRRFPVMISFFCAGVPSLTGARQILERMHVPESDVVDFRYRGEGWPGKAAVTTRHGLREEMSYTESWGEILSRNVQWRCRICPDGTGGFADIVCADAWEADDKGYPVFAEREGVSLVLSRTQKGEVIVKDTMTAGELVARPYPLKDLRMIQPGQRQKRQFTLPRLLALRLMGRPAPTYRGFHLFRNMLGAGPWPMVKNFLGTLRRAAAGARRSGATRLAPDPTRGG